MSNAKLRSDSISRAPYGPCDAAEAPRKTLAWPSRAGRVQLAPLVSCIDQRRRAKLALTHLPKSGSKINLIVFDLLMRDAC